MQELKITPRQYDWHKPTWCPGCGDFGLLEALKRAVANLGLHPKDVVLVTGIGCSSKIADYFGSYTFHALHGRALAIATAVKLVNPRLTVLVVSGDGDSYAIGMGHFIHAIRRNIDLTCIVMNNQVYGLTKGQYSPTAQMGFITGSTPEGSKEMPIDGATLALVAGATYVARSFSANIPQTTKLIEEGIKHKGFSLIDDLSPCVTFNKVNTYRWFRAHVYNLDEDKDYDHSDKVKALEKVMNPERIPLGLIYKVEKRSFEQLTLRNPDAPPVFEDLSIDAHDYASIMREFEQKI